MFSGRCFRIFDVSTGYQRRALALHCPGVGREVVRYVGSRAKMSRVVRALGYCASSLGWDAEKRAIRIVVVFVNAVHRYS